MEVDRVGDLTMGGSREKSSGDEAGGRGLDTDTGGTRDRRINRLRNRLSESDELIEIEVLGPGAWLSGY
jgi:hypothetical protein